MGSDFHDYWDYCAYDSSAYLYGFVCTYACGWNAKAIMGFLYIVSIAAP